jgi:hypothetical protein
MDKHDFESLDAAIKNCHDVDIEPKFRRRAEVAHAKL